MSQNDFNIANQGFPSFRADLNSSLQALASNSSGETEPDTTYAYQWWYDSTADVLKIRNADNDAWISFANFDQAADSWYFSGNVLVGTTIANGALSVQNTSTPIASYTAYFGPAASTNNIAVRGGSSTGTAIRFLNAVGTDCGSIDYTATSTSYTTSSDYRLKTDAQPMTGASARVQALNPINFEWLSDGTRVDGFLAHEAQEVVPEAVTGAKDAVDADGNPDYQGIDQSKLVPLLTAALQEALTKIDDLEARVASLEA